jgi:centromere/kinetochore protein ZW10
LSRNSAPNLDTWISQAKQLQHDIHESKVTAKHILEEGAKSYALHEKERDAASKADLLRNELDFNETLIGALEQIQIASSLLDKAKNAEAEGELVLAVQELGNAQRVTKELDGLQNSRFGGLLSRRAGQIKEGLATRLSKGWSALITPDHQLRKITIRSIVDVDGTEHNLADIVAALKELGTLETHVSRLYRELDSLIIGPRFSEAADGAVASLNIGGEDISVSGRADGHNLESLAADVKTLVSFLQERMPEAACTLLLERLLPNLLVRIVNDQLDPSVPVAVDKLVAYGPSLEHIQELATFVDSVGIEIPSDGNLSEWIERLPQNWLSRRREGALNSLRSASYGAVTQQKTAERVETQMVSSDDVMVAGEQQEDEWNEDWDDEDAAASKQEPEKPVKNDEDGEEAEGWGWGDDGDGEAKANQEASKPPEKKDEDDEDAEGWGWGGDEEAEENGESKQSVTPAKPAAPAKSAPRSNGPSKPKEVTHTEMTLRETFQITAIPDTLLDLIHAVLADASQISDPAFPIAEIRAASAALSPIPTLLLALYRATARSFYTSSPVADILIYNDASELATRLERLLLDLPEEHPLARRLPRAIESEIKSLQSFSRLAYGREMDSQRTILSDLLSATTGFESCTNPLNAREYTSAIDDVVARLREIDALWKDVLCDSARKQSLGTLLSHVTRKLVEDILELAGEPAGISEPESKQLKIYLDNVAQLADLFSVASPDGEARTLVHVYTPAWLRFVYLGEILEASLADIKFLWVEGELSLEFEADEIVELIQALFAESEHRRGAIREIRRSGRVGA